MAKKFKLVRIVWDDAHELAYGWKETDELKPQPELIESVGFLVQESESHVVLASCLSADGYHNGHFQIPRALIVSQRVLKI